MLDTRRIELKVYSSMINNSLCVEFFYKLYLSKLTNTQTSVFFSLLCKPNRFLIITNF